MDKKYLKKKYLTHLIIFMVALYLIINISVFSIVPFERLNNSQFWISWIFFFAVNSALTAVIGYKFIVKDSFNIKIIPVLTLALGIAVYLALGIVFTCLLPAIKYVVATEVCVTVAFSVSLIMTIGNADYNRMKKAYVKKKITYVRKITTLVESYASLAPDAETADELKRLSADFRFSDPMSHDSLEANESELMEMVLSLKKKVCDGDKEKINAYISKIRRELKLRNAESAQLK